MSLYNKHELLKLIWCKVLDLFRRTGELLCAILAPCLLLDIKIKIKLSNEKGN